MNILLNDIWILCLLAAFISLYIFLLYIVVFQDEYHSYEILIFLKNERKVLFVRERQKIRSRKLYWYVVISNVSVLNICTLLLNYYYWIYNSVKIILKISFVASTLLQSLYSTNESVPQASIIFEVKYKIVKHNSFI